MTHPLRGTCVPGCEMYGVCHCGCGEPTRIMPRTDSRLLMSKGQPLVHKHGHYAKTHPPNPMPCKGTVPVERILPLLDWLITNHGLQVTSAYVGIGTSNLCKVRRRVRMVHPVTAQKIVAAVLALRPPEAPYRTRTALPLERTLAQREHMRQDRAFYRAGGRKPQPISDRRLT